MGQNIELLFEEKEGAKDSEPEKSEYPALCILVEDLRTFLDIAHIFYGIKNFRIFPREYAHQPSEF